MAYLTATRYGLTIDTPTETEHTGGWRKVWRHPSGARAMLHPSAGVWVISWDYNSIESVDADGFSTTLQGCARRIDRKLAARGADHGPHANCTHEIARTA